MRFVLSLIESFVKNSMPGRDSRVVRQRMCLRGMKYSEASIQQVRLYSDA